MSILEKITDRFHYYVDSLKANKLQVKIESFIIDSMQHHIIVLYRIGRQKLLNKMKISLFEKEYFENVSYYDQHRLTKFSTLQFILEGLFSNNLCNRETLIKFIQEQSRNEQLF